MVNMEQHIATINVGLYDVFITDRRFVIIKIGNEYESMTSAAIGGIAGALIGMGISKLAENKKKGKLEKLTVDEILAKDPKSFEILYDNVTKIELHKSRFSRKLEITRRQNGQTDTLKYPISGDQFTSFKNTISGIGQLSSKLVISE